MKLMGSVNGKTGQEQQTVDDVADDKDRERCVQQKRRMTCNMKWTV